MAAVGIAIINTMLAWGFALRFIQRKRTQILFDAGLPSIAQGILAFLLIRFGAAAYQLQFSVLLFLLVTVIVQIQAKNGYGSAVLAFCLAQSVYSIFSYIGMYGYGQWKLKGLLVYLVCILIFAIILFQVRDSFPSADWQSFYGENSPKPQRLEWKLWQIYVLAGGLAVVFVAWTLFLGEETLSIRTFLFSGVAMLALFESEILLFILMHSYKKERIEALLEHQYRDEMQSFMNVIRSQRHDYNFHVQTIAGLLRQGDMKECLKYMDALEKDSIRMNEILPVKDPAISAMIHNFQSLAAREGIALHIDIENDLTQIATNVYETNKIISNLLQNAIDETKTHEDKSYGIHLTILKRGEYIVIRVSNLIDPAKMSEKELSNIYKQGYSTKQGQEGVGLSSIRQLAGRYRGTIYTQLEEDQIHFVAKIPINYAKKQEEET